MRFDEINRRFDRIEGRLDEHDRRLDALVVAVAADDRKLDVLDAQMRLLVGGMGLRVTVLIAVFAFLFTNTN